MTILDLIERETNYTYRKAGSSGKEYAGVCPWCGGEGGTHGKGGRFRIWPSKGRYWCRECGRKGDSIQFMRDYRGLSFRQASQYGCVNNINDIDDTNDTLDTGHTDDTNQQKPLQPPCQAWTESAYPFLAECQAGLWDGRGAKALAWLHGRGLSYDTIRQAGLGYNPMDGYIDRDTWGLPPEANKQGQPKRLWLPRGVVIPWTIDGTLWGLRIRRSIGYPRYYFVPGGTSNGLYNADALTSGKPAVLLEGEFDALTVFQANYIAVATGSTHAARRTRWLARLSLASVVLVSYDADEAGEKAAPYWVDNLKNAQRWRPYWADANQLVQDGVNLRLWVEAGLRKANPELNMLHELVILLQQHVDNGKLPKVSNERLADLAEKLGVFKYPEFQISTQQALMLVKRKYEDCACR